MLLPHKLKSPQQGIALLEAVLAIVILGIGLLGAVGLQARGISALSDAGIRTEATLATSKLVGIMSADVTKDPGAADDNLGEYNYDSSNGDQPSARLRPWLADTMGAIPNATIKINVVPVTLSSKRVDVSISWWRKQGDPSNSHMVSFYTSRSK